MTPQGVKGSSVQETVALGALRYEDMSPDPGGRRTGSRSPEAGGVGHGGVAIRLVKGLLGKIQNISSF